LAPDGKIYVAAENGENKGLGYLGTINHPGRKGLACDYVPQSFYLGGKETRLGLPNFAGSFFYHPEDFQVTGSCQGGATAFKISNTKNIDSVKWDFGDHAVSASINPAHTYRQPGTYRVRLIIFYPWAKDTAFKEITIHGAYKRTTIARICTGQTWLLPDGRRVGKTGVYTAAFRDRYGCDSVITTRLIAGVPYHHAVQDSICPHQPYQLPDGRTVDSAGTYLSSFLTVNGCDSTITTRLSYRHPLYLRAEESICAGTAFRLPNGRAIDREGTFRVKLPSATGCDTVVTYRISMKHPPVVSLGADTCLVPGQRLTLNAGKGYAHYQWQDGSMLPQKEVTFAGTYAVIVSNSCGIGLDSIRVSMDCTAGCRFPTAFTPNGDGVNDVFRILNIHGQKLLDFCVYDRWGKRVFYTKDIFRGWDGTSRGRPAGTGPYIYFAEIVDLDGSRQVYKGTVLLIR
ncbi:MAG TPA: gliding motility-associated C-terminal domain-containing protein, partial [Chitinophagaceae bacterium]|nr:gliding motility-associated C-terminal domain-containing protein [Chitinophagaceae bacterium]